MCPEYQIVTADLKFENENGPEIYWFICKEHRSGLYIRSLFDVFCWEIKKQSNLRMLRAAYRV